MKEALLSAPVLTSVDDSKTRGDSGTLNDEHEGVELAAAANRLGVLAVCIGVLNGVGIS